MLNFNQLKATFIVLLFTVASLSTLRGMEKPPAYAGEEITLVSSDGKEFKLDAEVAAKFSEGIEGFLKSPLMEETKERRYKLSLFDSKPLEELVKLIAVVQQAISKQDEENSPLIMDGDHIFANGLQPVVNKQFELPDFKVLANLLKLTDFLVMPAFTNALVATYFDTFNIPSLEFLNQLLEKQNIFEPSIKELFVKHWYQQQAGVTVEWSIKDLIKLGVIKLEKNYFDGLLELNISKNKDDYPLRTSSQDFVRHLPKLTSLEGLQDIPDIEKVEAINLRGNGLTVIDDATFRGLPQLKRLNLGENQIITVSDNAFSDLVLEELDLSTNKITMLPENIFKGLTALNAFNLSNNKLSTLPESIFKDLTALVDLVLANNKLSMLSEGIFKNLTALERLGLAGNQLSTLPDTIFNNLTALKILDLQRNKFTTLPEFVFDGLASLEGLSLENNKLNKLPEDIFKTLTNLEYLSLSRNDLDTLPVKIFNNTDLNDLDLSSNDFKTLPEGIFKGLKSLKELDLSNNQISSLPDNIFDDLVSILDINLKKNALTARESILIKARPEAAVLINEWDHKPFRL